MKLHTLRRVKPLFLRFLRFSPWGVARVFLLMILTGLTSGVGILLIIPLLQVVGISLGGVSQASGGDVGRRITELAAHFDFSFSLGGVLSLYLALMVGVGALSYFNATLGASLRKAFVSRIRNDIYSKLLYAQWQFLSGERMAEYARLVTHQVNTVGVSVQLMLTLCSQLVLIAVYLCMSLLLSPVLTGLALLCTLGLVALLLPLNRYIHQSGSVGLRAGKRLFTSVVEELSSLKIIKSFAAEPQYLRRMERVGTVIEEQQVRLTRFNALSRFVNLSGAALIFTGLFYVAVEVLALPVANLILILLIFARLMPQFSALQSGYQRLLHTAPEFSDLMSKAEQLNRQREPASERGRAPQLRSELRLENLGYTYPGKNTPVFSGLNARIGRNRTVALVGPSGAGKSTLADLLAGLIPPGSGRILADDTVIDDSNRHHWRTRVAYVTQDVFLFNDTVRVNLDWISPQPVADDRLWHALELAAAADFVRALPGGLEALIGDRGVKLSGGERQRLALARALVAEPELLILDEATSALDRDNELRIKEALVNLDGRLTIIIIAHDETTVGHVTQRIELS